MTPSKPVTELRNLLDRLRDEAARLSGRSLDRGCVDSGIAANLAEEAADALDLLEAENARARNDALEEAATLVLDRRHIYHSRENTAAAIRALAAGERR